MAIEEANILKAAAAQVAGDTAPSTPVSDGEAAVSNNKEQEMVVPAITASFKDAKVARVKILNDENAEKAGFGDKAGGTVTLDGKPAAGTGLVQMFTVVSRSYSYWENLPWGNTKRPEEYHTDAALKDAGGQCKDESAPNYYRKIVTTTGLLKAPEGEMDSNMYPITFDGGETRYAMVEYKGISPTAHLAFGGIFLNREFYNMGEPINWTGVTFEVSSVCHRQGVTWYTWSLGKEVQTPADVATFCSKIASQSQPQKLAA
jgi:hypothetical protein